jgi:hypothetical protein
MALKRITLTPADRQIVQLLIAKPGGKAGVDLARKVREVRRRFDVRQFEKQLDKLNERLAEWRIRFSTWDNLMDATELLAEIVAMSKEEEVEEEKTKLAKLLGRVKAFVKPREYTIDEIYLAWLQELIQARDWSKARQMQQDGSSKEIETDVHSSHMEAIAEFADVVRDAVAADSITEEKEGRK